MSTSNPKPAAWLLLFGRTGLFILFQASIALVFLVVGADQPWDAGAAWWPFTVTLVNLVCVAVMIRLYRREGKNYWDIFRFRRDTIKADLLALLGASLVFGPLGFFPNILLANWLFADPQQALELLVRPLPLWAAYAGMLAFPLTQGLAELPLYFRYVMPRLDGRAFPDLRPVLLPALMLGLQHFAIPLVFDVRFLLWRAFMYLPFALAIGIVLHWRPRLLPYLAVIHVLMDLSFAAMLLGSAY